MKRRLAAGLFLALLLVLFIVGCRKPVPAPKIENLAFPVVVLFENSSVLLCADREGLTRMHTNSLNLNHQDPWLIDSNCGVFTMEKLRSVHNGFWLMANPIALTEVTFELKPQKSGRAEAQRLFAEQLRKQTWRQDQAARLQSLAQSQTLLEMEKAIRPGED